MKKTTRPTIGVFLGQLEERYQFLLWPGMVDSAEELNLNLIFFPGAPLDVDLVDMAQRNIIYDLVLPDTLDGLIILSGSLSAFVDKDAFNRFCYKYKDLPIVSISLPLEGASNVLVDNKKGMYDVVSHLIEVHGYQRIAFIRGPDGHGSRKA